VWIVRKFDQGFTGLTYFYDRTLHVVLRHQRITLLVTLGTVAVAVLLAMHVPKGFFPIEDTGTINAVTEAAPDVSFQRMTQLQEEVVKVILHDPDVATVSSSVGADGTNPKFDVRPSLAAIEHEGQFASLTLSYDTAKGVSLGEAVKAIDQAIAEINAPPAMRGRFVGAAQVFRESLASEPVLILAALITVYIVLGVLYESYIHPITILSTLPSAGIGAILALEITGEPFDVIALIGIVLLIGIVKKNAIMMIDFALVAEREHKMPPLEAIHKACLLRFRPIMMTTMAALVGGLPLAIGGGIGSELRRPLGITIVGGLLLSQVLTLYTTPVIYLGMDRVARALRRFRGKPEHEPPEVSGGDPGASDDIPHDAATESK